MFWGVGDEEKGKLHRIFVRCLSIKKCYLRQWYCTEEEITQIYMYAMGKYGEWSFKVVSGIYKENLETGVE